jgi:hypothetical protein
MYLKYKMIFHDQDGQHSYVDLVMCLMVSRSGMSTISVFTDKKIQCNNSQHMQASLMMTNIGRNM